MHFQCPKQDLLPIINQVEKALPAKDTVPILAGIKLTVEDHVLTVLAQNQELLIQTQTPVQMLTAGSALLEGKLFSSLIKKSPDEPLIFEKKRSQVEIHAGTVEFSLQTMNQEEYPELPPLKNKILSIPSKTLLYMIRNTLFATQTDENRPYFGGCLFEIEESMFSIIATDSNRLAFIQTPLSETIASPLQLIVPARTLLELTRCLSSKETPVHISSLNQQQIAFQFEDTLLISRLINSKFPNYRAVLPGPQPISITIKKSSLLQAMERAALFDYDGKRPIILSTTNGVLELRNLPSDHGCINERINVEQTGANGQAAFSPRFLLDMLRVSSSELITLEYNEDLRQGRIIPHDDDTHIYVIMPVKV